MQSPVSWQKQNSIAIVTLDTPGEKVNILDRPFMDALRATVEELAASQGLTAVIIRSNKHAGFIAGADIQVIEDVTDPVEGMRLAQEGQALFQLWEDLEIPVIAAIHGHCLGGGCEFALACDYRLAGESLAMALPEVKLGILPGFGGTQRLPRLVGLENALDMILTGRTMRASRAKAIGLIDESCADDNLLEQAMAMADRVATAPEKIKKARASGRGLRHWLLEGNPLGRKILFEQANQGVRAKTGGHYPAPLKALDVIQRTFGRTATHGYEIEARALGELVVTVESKNLVHLFHLSQRPKKSPGLLGEPVRIEQAAVLGAGVMGASIAWLVANDKVPVILKDIDDSAMQKGMAHARKLFERKLAKRGGEQAVEDAMSHIRGTIDYERFETVDLVIEAVLERMEVKQAVLKETEQHLSEQAVFATNTSALSVTTLQKTASRPNRVVGMHFFNPVDRMPLVEVIRGAETDDSSLATVYELARRLDKIPIIVADRPGFLVNRLLVTYLNEACVMVEEGCDWQSLERQATTFGMPMGPFRLVDEVGVDIAMEVGRTLTDAFHYLPTSQLLDKLLSAGLLGKKGSKGFYDYTDGKKTVPNPALAGLLPKATRPTADSDWERLMLVMVAEATRCLHEKVIESAADIDTGMIFGTGFPPFRGGLCRWSDSTYGERLVARLNILADSHGERFRPAGGLDRFYSQG